MSDSIKIRRVGAELFHVVGQTTTTKLIVAFCNFANASKNENYVLKITRVGGKIPGLDFFFFLLTVHLSIILVINQLDAQILVL